MTFNEILLFMLIYFSLFGFILRLLYTDIKAQIETIFRNNPITVRLL